MEDLLTEPLLPPSISMVQTTEMLEADRVSIVTFKLLCIVLYTATSGFGLPLSHTTLCVSDPCGSS